MKFTTFIMGIFFSWGMVTLAIINLIYAMRATSDAKLLLYSLASAFLFLFGSWVFVEMLKEKNESNI